MTPPGARALSVATRLLTLAAAVALVSCGAATGDSARDVPLPFAGGVPSPTGDVLLTVQVDGEAVRWDRELLTQLPQSNLTILEPFVIEELTFTGPAWADVLEASGVASDVQVDLVALDDYEASLTADPDVLEGVMLATLSGGEEIPIEDGGPIRLVFPEGHELADNQNNWIWSIRDATVAGELSAADG